MAENKGTESAPSHTTLLFVAVTATTTAVTYNTMAVVTAIPPIKAEFAMSLTMAQWLMNGYSLASAVLVAAMGRFGDMLGHMRVIVFGMSCFLLGSLAVMLAGDAMVAIAGRVLQGIGAAGILSTSLAILNSAVPEDKRAAAVGLWGAVLALGTGLGSIIGGALTVVSWRAVFAFDVILVLPALIMALRVVLAMREPSAESRQTLDISGLILLVLFLGPLAFALAFGQETGWTAIETVVPLVVAVASGALLVVAEFRAKAPLIRFDFFRRPRYVAGTAGMFLVASNTGMIIYFYMLFAQSPDGLSYTAVTAGLSLLPFSLAMFLFAVVVPRAPRIAGASWPAGAGMAAMAIGFWFAQDISSISTFGDIWWPLALIGTGSGLGYSLLPHVALGVLPEEDTGQGSGVVNTCLYFGLTMGVVLGGIVSAVSLHTSLTSALSQSGLASAERSRLVDVLVHGTPGEIETAFERAVATGASGLEQATQAAIETSFGDVMQLGTAIAVVGLVLMVWLLRGRPEPIGTGPGVRPRKGESP